MDLFPSKVRFRNIFGQSGDNRRLTRDLFPVPKPTTTRTTSVNKAPLAEPDAAQMLMDLYNEDSPAVTRLSGYLDEQPDRDDFIPSKKRKVGSILAGFLTGMVNPAAGAAVTRGVLDKPYEDQLESWERKGAPIKAAAAAETTARTQKINSLKDYLQARRQSVLDESLITDRNLDNKRADNQFLETIAKNQADEKFREEEAKRREEERIRAERNRTEDNKRADAAFEESKRATRAREKATEVSQEIARDRATAYKASIDGLNAYRDHLKSKVKPNDKSPASQKAAKELATINIFMKPGNSQRYADFLEQDEKGKIILKPPSRGMFSDEADFTNEMLEYSNLLRELETEERNILGTSGVKPVVPPKSTVPPKPAARVIGRERT